MPQITVLPRDIQPGDKIERLTHDLDVVWVEVANVIPWKIKGRTKSYGIYLVPPVEENTPEDLILHRIASWKQYAHYRRFTLQPTAKVKVERSEV